MDEVFTEIMTKLLKAAEQDGIISVEEREIIEQVKFDADVFSLLVKDAYEDDVITDEERSQLLELKERILERAEIIAGLDGTVTDDERKLLEILTEILKHKYTFD